MMIGRNRFNIYLLLPLTLLLAAGCRTNKDDKKAVESKMMANLRIHLEIPAEPMDFSVKVPVYRAKPVMVNVDKAPFLTENNLSEARLLDVLGGFEIQLQFDRQGTWILEEYTTTNPGRRFAIFCAWEGRDLKKEARWLSAPVIPKRVSNGILLFTPDASREESEDIVRGLNNAIKKHKKESEW
jgi:preprotein translocase subunit SecD